MRRPFAIALLILLLAAPSLAAPTTAPAPDDAAVLAFLNQTIDWYRRINGQDQPPLDSQEYIYRQTARDNARQTLRLAFDFARAQAALLSNNPKTPPTTSKSTTGRNLAAAEAGATSRLAELRMFFSAIASRSLVVIPGSALARSNSRVSPTSRPTLEARRDKLNSAIDLTNAQINVLHEYAGFVTTAEGNGAANLSDKIDDQMLVTPHVYGLPGAHAPLLHLRRLGEGDLFATYAESLERVWAVAHPAWP